VTLIGSGCREARNGALALIALVFLWIAGWLLLSLVVLRWWSQVQWVGRPGAIVVWVAPAPPAHSVAYMAPQTR
jgi:hypothetical protein